MQWLLILHSLVERDIDDSQPWASIFLKVWFTDQLRETTEAFQGLSETSWPRVSWRWIPGRRFLSLASSLICLHPVGRGPAGKNWAMLSCSLWFGNGNKGSCVQSFMVDIKCELRVISFHCYSLCWTIIQPTLIISYGRHCTRCWGHRDEMKYMWFLRVRSSLSSMHPVIYLADNSWPFLVSGFDYFSSVTCLKSN